MSILTLIIELNSHEKRHNYEIKSCKDMSIILMLLIIMIVIIAHYFYVII